MPYLKIVEYVADEVAKRLVETKGYSEYPKGFGSEDHEAVNGVVKELNLERELMLKPGSPQYVFFVNIVNSNLAQRLGNPAFTSQNIF